MSPFRSAQWVIRAAGLLALLCFAFSLIVWYAAYNGDLFILGFFGIKFSLGVIGFGAFIRLIFALLGSERVSDRLYEGLLWSSVVLATIPGILLVMGGWMWFLVYPNWEEFLSYGLIGSVPAALLGTAALIRKAVLLGRRPSEVNSSAT